MKLLIFSDIHSDLKSLERLMRIEADYYFAAGDLVNWSRGLDACGDVLKQRAGKMFVIPGNHETTGQIAQLCDKFSLNYFHEETFDAQGWHIAGLGYSNPTPFDTPGEYTEEQLQERLDRFAGLQPLIAICHCPPYGTRLDRMTNLKHAGSRAVRTFIQEQQPRYFFCGHIHEAAGVAEKLGETSAMNVGKKGYLLELESPPPGIGIPPQ